MKVADFFAQLVAVKEEKVNFEIFISGTNLKATQNIKWKKGLEENESLDRDDEIKTLSDQNEIRVELNCKQTSLQKVAWQVL